MKRLRKTLCLFTMLTALLFLFIPTQTQAATVKLNKTEVSLGMGERTSLKVQNSKGTVKWTSSDKKIATVSKGTVTGVAPGKAIITAKVNKKSYTCKVIVSEIGLENSTLSLIRTQSKTLLTKNISGSIKWSSSNKKIATVNSKGKVSAKSAGKATITAKVGKTSYKCNLTVKQAGINKSNATVYLRKPITLKVIGDSGSVSWSTSNKKIATVDNKGKVTAIKTGKTTIKAKLNGKTYKCSVTVKKPKLNKTKISIDEEANYQLKLVGATIKKVVSSDKTIVKVTNKGKITALKEGSCKITVTDTKKRTYKATITVNGIHDVNTNNVESPYFDVIKASVIAGETYQLTLKDNSQAVSWNSSNASVASVDANGLVTGVSAGTAVVNATVGDKTFSCSFDVTASGNPAITYTRGEWISLLLKQVGIDVASYQDDLLLYYCDTKGHTYGKDIEIAKIMGIIPANEAEDEVPVFDPDALATREFAAITAINSLGYQLEDRTVTFGDAGQITYKHAVDIAVKEKMFILSDNNFYPANVITDADKVRIFTRIYEIINEPTNFMEHLHAVYEEDVIVNKLAQYTDYAVTQNADGTYTIVINNDSEISYLKNGYKVVMPVTALNPHGISLLLNADATTVNNTVTMTGTLITDINQVIKDMSFAGYGTVLVDGIKTADGVTLTNVENNVSTKSSDIKGTSNNGLTAESNNKGALSAGALTFDFAEKDLGNGGKLFGSIKINLPTVTASFDMNGILLNEMSISVKDSLILESGLQYDSSESKKPFEYKFAEFPIALPAGMNITLSAKVYFEVDGTISVKFEHENEFGVFYKDGELRHFEKADTNELSILQFEGNAGLGLGISGDLYYLIWDLVGVDCKAGPSLKATGGLALGETNFDVAAYLSMKIEVRNGDDTALGVIADIFHWSELPSWTVFDENNSPWKKTFHISNGVVGNDTSEKGNISGYVYVAGETTPLKNARVVLSRGDVKDEILYTDNTGKFVSTMQSVGSYTLTVSATGYKTFSDQETITANNTTYTEVFMMVDKANVNDGTVRGTVYNAVGGYVAGTSYVVRNGWNNIVGGTPVTSGTLDGEYYDFNLEPGNYTIMFSLDGFTSAHVNVSVISNKTTIGNVTMSPIDTTGLGGQIRIVLTWGSSPRDLDSHLFGPTADGSNRFHIYYNAKNYNVNSQKYAMLDVDDTSSYGPETVTINKMNATGTYSYYVHNFSGGASNALSTSSARIQVYDGNTLLATYNVPVNIDGRIWHVFDYDAATHKIKVSNEFSNTFKSTSDLFMSGVMLSGALDEQNDITAILASESDVKPEEAEENINTLSELETETDDSVLDSEDTEKPSEIVDDSEIVENTESSTETTVINTENTESTEMTEESDDNSETPSLEIPTEATETTGTTENASEEPATEMPLETTETT